MSVDLLPCPFCGGEAELWDGRGTQADLTCGDCGNASINMQVSDCLTQEEKYGNNGNAHLGFAWIDSPDYRYEEKAIVRVNAEMIEAWNQRVPTTQQVVDGDLLDKAARAIYANHPQLNGISRIGKNGEELTPVIPFEELHSLAQLEFIEDAKSVLSIIPAQPSSDVSLTVTQLLASFEALVKNIPLGEESVENGRSYYNWGVYWLNQCRAIASNAKHRKEYRDGK